MCTPRSFCKWLKRRIFHCWVGCKTPGCRWYGCCKCPHGPCYTVMGVVGGFGGVFMQLYVLMACKFQRITKLNAVTGEPIASTQRGYGLFARELAYGESPSYQQCIAYPSDELGYLMDPWMKWARIFGLLAGILALVSFVVLIASYCCLFTPWTFERWILWCYLYAAMSVAMTMLLYGWEFCSENKCKVANGTGYAISSFFTFLMLANQVKAMGQPPDAQNMPQPGGREDDYWYDDEDERFLPDSDEESEEEDEDDKEQFEDELNEPDPSKYFGNVGRNRRRRRKKKPDGDEEDQEEGTFANNPHAAYDEMQEYMTPEERYAPTRDDNFLEQDMKQQEPYREQQQRIMDMKQQQEQQRLAQERQRELMMQQQQQQQQSPSTRSFFGRRPQPAAPPQQQSAAMGVGYEEEDPDDHLGDKTLI